MTLKQLFLVAALTGLVSSIGHAGTEKKSADTKAMDSEAAEVATATDPQYSVIDGKADKATFNGYRRFHGTCHACHGQDAAGGSFAPSLVESMKELSYEDFIATVMEGREVSSASGGTSAMPAFANDPNITKHIDDIYKYVKARSDGALGTGRPEKQPKKK